MTDNRGEVKWIVEKPHSDRKDVQTVVDAKYSRVGERIRHIAPSALQCSVFCGGKQCKYDNPAKWRDEEMAIKGLYSSWITNDILAMARPSTYAIKEYDVINQFKLHGIATVINLQHPGEHASCGFGLEDGGFSYVPQQFMDEDVFFYNFCWDDYGVRALQSILDMVKVMDFALMNGKVAIHCHAGLGRTGVLIACYFVYSQRMKGNSAINTIRAKRPKAIQTRGQIACVRDFEKYMQPMWIIFSYTLNHRYKPFTLSQFLRRQAHILHGEEERDLRYVPKIIFIICQRLLHLSGIDYELRSIALFRRRTFGSTSVTETCSENGSSDQQINLPPEHGRKVISDSLLVEHGCRDDEKEMTDVSLDANVFYDSFADGPEGIGDMDELSPEQFLRHSVSESALSKGLKVSPDIFNEKHHSLHNIRSSVFDHSSKVDMESNYSEMETARFSGADEVITIDVKKPETNLRGKKSANLSQKFSDFDDKDNVHLNNNSANSLVSTTTEYATSQQSLKSEAVNVSRNSHNAEVGGFLESISPSLATKVSYSRISILLEKYKNGLNTTETVWEQISNDDNALVLCCLLWSWLEHLEEPVITTHDIEVLMKDVADPVKAFEQLDRGKRKTLQVVLFTFLKISKTSDEFKSKVLQKIGTVFTNNAPSPEKTRSEREALDQGITGNKAQKNILLRDFLDFIIKFSSSKLFDE